MSEPRRQDLFLTLAGGIAATGYWLLIGTFSVAQFWTICSPGAAGCPSTLEMSARAASVLGAGVAVFAAGVWMVRRIPSAATFLASAVVAVLLAFAVALIASG